MSDLSVKSATHNTSHVLEIEFSDGYVGCVDFAPFIFSNEHPDYKKYREIEEFLKYEIIDGNLNWDDYTMIFPVEDLRKNKLIK